MGAKKPLISESNSTFGFFCSSIYSHPKGNFNLHLYSILAPYFMPKFVFIKRLYTLPLQYVKSLKIEIKRQKKEYAITHTLLYIILPNYPFEFSAFSSSSASLSISCASASSLASFSAFAFLSAIKAFAFSILIACSFSAFSFSF